MRTSKNISTAVRWLICLLVLTVSQSGCQMFRNFHTRPEPAPTILQPAPTQQHLLATLNDQAAKVNQLQTDVSLSLDGMPRLKGTLQLERPDRMRLKAGVMGVSELGVDVGSNSDQFWVWSKASLPGQPPAIYFADHRNYQANRSRLAIPLEPQWIIDASGLVEFRSDEVHQGPFPGPGGRLQLHSIRQTPSGPVTRVCTIEPQTARIVQIALYDASSQLIAWSNSSRHRYYADVGVSLPQRIELHLMAPNGEDVKLVLEAGEYSLNSLYGDPDRMWTMPTPEGIPRINLAQ